MSWCTSARAQTSHLKGGSLAALARPSSVRCPVPICPQPTTPANIVHPLRWPGGVQCGHTTVSLTVKFNMTGGSCATHLSLALTVVSCMRSVVRTKSARRRLRASNGQKSSVFSPEARDVCTVAISPLVRRSCAHPRGASRLGASRQECPSILHWFIGCDVVLGVLAFSRLLHTL
jgi:hypothetical protein